MSEAVGPTTPPELVEAAYAKFASSAAIARARLGRPLTFGEKVLFSHADDPHAVGLARGADYGDYRPDRVALQDALAQVVLLQFMLAGLSSSAVPATVHCDHLIRARVGADADLAAAVDVNREVYDFLAAGCAKYGLGFWQPGSGIIHQVVLENYACPGGMMIGTDSHTPNAGGLGMVAVGVGGGDAVDVMSGWPFNLRVPKHIGVRLVGTLSGWTAPKDIILKVAGTLGVKGGTGAIVEYFGPGARSISATGKATVCNMGAEIGATCSLFPYDAKIAEYLRATGRADIAGLADRHADQLDHDDEVEADPGRFFDRVVEVDLDELEPHLVGPRTPDLDRPVSEIAAEAEREGYPREISAALVGSCTNSSYEDIGRAAHVARQAVARGLRVRCPLMVTPGSEQVRATIERDGLLADLEAIGATVLANACGPCIGQWQREGAPSGTNVIVTSFNRNFPARNDGREDTLAFIGSPETVVGMALTGRLDGSFVHDFDAPVADDLPAHGFERGAVGFLAPAADPASVVVTVRPDSERIELLAPFEAWDGRDIHGLRVLLKARGKCTTDQVSPAGKWLDFRGHLGNISRNLVLGAVNAFTDEPGFGVDARDGSVVPLPDLAASYKRAGIDWIVIADDNYGEGSSRELAAMEPRFMGGRVVLARSFARIAESNLKKQGVLTLVFADPADYERVEAADVVDVLDLSALAPGSTVKVALHHADGTTSVIAATHSLSAEHVEWFRAGSALNRLAARH
jgi:aconitate hydratase